jgi:hypothetical protein
MPDDLIRIHEVPLWTLVPYAAIVIGGLVATVRWILKHPQPE